ncbi:ATP-binding protein [Raoultibacter phocaeensis]|uniref:ATP-binding protein n=1 Tax=Raoultibacter phocaeensis TaxID=2479841 RepID=UPI001118F866|nr:AAA family ATPase [Raoultibacter phocaeensis]
MNIAEAKQQVKDTIEAYLARDAHGCALLDTARQRPVFLVGAPGIGKTAIMAQIAQELGMGLVSYSMTHHTRQSALGLPFIVHETYDGVEYAASEYTMSEIIASVYDYMKRTGVKQGILFLDEINCVSETLYPSMLQFLQFKTFGRHAVPEGWIIACAGNPPEYNKSVHEFDIVTLDRVKKIAVEPDFGAWKAYALSKGTHPAILTFLEIKKNRFYSVETSLEGKAFVTARGWDDLSDMMAVFEELGKTIDYDLIVQYVQDDTIAREFAAYFDLFNKYKDDYRIDEILDGGDVADVAERARGAQFDERLSLIGLLLDAVVGDMADVVGATDVLVALRDDLRCVKQAVSEGGDALALLEDVERRKTAQLELAAAAGTLSKARRKTAEGELEELAELALAAAGAADSQEAYEIVSQEFSAKAEALQSRAAEVEERLARAFRFVDQAFGDQQELLVFTTELTSRTHSARYIAQYGSESYFAHNEDMILSERQRDLRRRVEDLDL